MYRYGTWQALLLTYGRYFAEFLEDLSLVRLGLLDLTTCVGLRYGPNIFNLRRFSRKRAPLNFPPKKNFRCAFTYLPDLPNRHNHTPNANPIMRSKYNTPSLHRNILGSRNINLVSIGSDFRHLLRPD